MWDLLLVQTEGLKNSPGGAILDNLVILEEGFTYRKWVVAGGSRFVLFWLFCLDLFFSYHALCFLSTVRGRSSSSTHSCPLNILPKHTGPGLHGMNLTTSRVKTDSPLSILAINTEVYGHRLNKSNTIVVEIGRVLKTEAVFWNVGTHMWPWGHGTLVIFCLVNELSSSSLCVE